MEENKDFFDFGSEDIFSSSAGNAKEYEDIVSSSKMRGKHYAKKKRGNAFTKWWRSCKKWQRVSMITVTSLVLVVAIAVGVLRIVFNYNYNNITKNPEDLGFESVINDKIVNIALFGIDTREPKSFKGLSDSIMILSLNTETKKVKLMSVMRDTLVPITYNGKTTYAKINSAYSKGGPELAIKTLNTIFKLDISEYATVNFYGMSDIIEAVGGIDVELAKGELDVIGRENGHRVNYGLNGCIYEICEHKGLDANKYYIRTAGVQHLNGVQAVAYARIRHAANIEGTNDDYGRTDRQRYVMEQLFNKAIKLGKSQYIKLAKSLMPCSETSLSYSEILSLAVNILLQSPTFEQTRIPDFSYQMPSKSISGVGSCVYYDLNYASKLIHAFIYDDIKPEDYIEANGVEKNDWYTGSSVKRPSSNSSTVKNRRQAHRRIRRLPLRIIRLPCPSRHRIPILHRLCRLTGVIQARSRPCRIIRTAPPIRAPLHRRRTQSLTRALRRIKRNRGNINASEYISGGMDIYYLRIFGLVLRGCVCRS